MNRAALVGLLQAAEEFFLFAPKRQLIIFTLMLLQGATTGIGLLLILPLLELVGFETGMGNETGISQFMLASFRWLGIEPSLASVLVSYILLVTLIASVRYQLSTRSVALQQAYTSHLRVGLYQALLKSHWQFITEHKMSDFIHRLSGQVQSVGHAAQLLFNLLSQGILLLVMVALAFALSWQMSLVALAFAGCLVIVLLPFNKLIYGSGSIQLGSFKSIFQMLNEQLSSLKMIKSYASEAYHVQKMREESERLEAQQVNFSRLNAATQWLYLVSAVIAFSAFFYLSQTQFATPLSTTLLLLIIFSRLLPQISGLQKIYQQLLHKVPAFTDVRDMYAACLKAAEPDLANVKCPKLERVLTLDGVTYRYPSQPRPVIKGLSITIPKNSTVALVGPSGAGKSTLADIIAGLLVPDGGTVYCDDAQLTGDLRLAWRERVAYVTQEVFLFHDTVRANLSWVCQQPPNDATLWKSLEQAAADEFVRALHNGLDTVIGDRGVRLSGGERQRLALARALLSKPQFLILDEATSALDTINEQHIRRALQKLHGKLTILIIAHREATIQHADLRIELHKDSCERDCEESEPADEGEPC